MNMEKEFEMMRKELNELKVEKENLEQKVIELNRLNESIKNVCCLFLSQIISLHVMLILASI